MQNMESSPEISLFNQTGFIKVLLLRRFIGFLVLFIASLNVETDRDDVSVLHDVFFALKLEKTLFLEDFL